METTYQAERPRRWRWLAIVPLSILTLLVLAGIAISVIAQSVHVRKETRTGGDGFTIETPAGKFSIRGGDRAGVAELGVPAYPGATRLHGSGGATFSWSSADGADEKNIAVAGAEMLTSDSPNAVLTFYREQLPNWIVETDRGGGMQLELREGGMKRMVHVRERSDGTHIGVATVGTPASN